MILWPGLTPEIDQLCLKTNGTRWNTNRCQVQRFTLFRMSWQLELWLRDVTHVEVRASHADWQDFRKKEIKRWPDTALSNDKKLSHMATAHESELSYLSFGQLCDFITSNRLWIEYLPPFDNFNSRVEEVKTIRNRVAHCRRPHANDERRLDVFLRDLDPGIRKFCV